MYPEMQDIPTIHSMSPSEGALCKRNSALNHTSQINVTNVINALLGLLSFCVCAGDRQPDNRLYELCLIKLNLYSVKKLMMVS